MTAPNTALTCDLDADRQCTASDVAVFQATNGLCTGDPNYYVVADVDLDGCVTMLDEQSLFQVTATLQESPLGTVVFWNPIPSANTYEVVRGDVESLTVSGGNIDLGSTLCVEAGSVNESTVGFEDDERPVAGSAFFYVVGVEYENGFGGFGRSSDGSRRASAAPCSPQ